MTESSGQAARGLAHSSFVESLSSRLRSAGFMVGAGGAYQIQGSVSMQVGRNRLLNVGEINVSTALKLTDSSGKEIAQALLYEEAYTGEDVATALKGLLEKQADETVLRVNQHLCMA